MTPPPNDAMCFYNGDHEWYADVYRSGWGKSAHDDRCDECCGKIEAGTPGFRIWQQQREECPHCGAEDDDGCVCGPDVEFRGCGESYEYVRCAACDSFLEVVEAVEAEAGCPAGSRRPMLEIAWGSMIDIEEDERRQYVERAVAEHPELRRHRPVDRIIEGVRINWEEQHEEGDPPLPALYAPLAANR